jgi:hypothetical protein
MTGIQGTYAGFAVFNTTRATEEGLPVPLKVVYDPKFGELHGPMTISPDGKWISFTSGTLLQLVRTPGEQAPAPGAVKPPGATRGPE